MTDVMENKARNEGGGVYEDVVAFLVNSGLDATDAHKLSAMVTSFAIEFGKKEIPVTELRNVKVLAQGGTTVVGSALTLINEGSKVKTVAMSLANYFATGLGTALIGSLGTGLAVSGSAVLAGVVAGIGVSYLVDVGWDTFIGPHAEMHLNDIVQEYEFTVNGKLSDFLRPREGLLQDMLKVIWPDDFGNVWERCDLSNANEWNLKSADSSIPLEIKYEGGAIDSFNFDGVGGTQNLVSIYQKDVEYRKTIDIILEEYNSERLGSHQDNMLKI